MSEQEEETRKVAGYFSRIKTGERKNKYPESVTKKGLSPQHLQTLQISEEDFISKLGPMNLKKIYIYELIKFLGKKLIKIKKGKRHLNSLMILICERYFKTFPEKTPNNGGFCQNM